MQLPARQPFPSVGEVHTKQLSAHSPACFAPASLPQQGLRPLQPRLRVQPESQPQVQARARFPMKPLTPAQLQPNMQTHFQQTQLPQQPRQPPQPQQCQPLGPGAAVPLAGQGFTIIGPLGKGSFGVVWEAQNERGVSVALKEMQCKSESEVVKVQAEGKVLEVVRREVTAAGLATERVPALVAMEAEQTEQRRWQVRLAMSLVPGVSLESFLERQRQVAKARSVSMDAAPHEQFAEACLCAGRLLLQLAPVLDVFSARFYHRDITPRNIQIHEMQGAAGPEFGLVDFGLAVDAGKWRAADPRAGDLAGDGRYWPASSWFVFCHGTRALERDECLRVEYRTSLDAHSLGLTALRCLVEMLPPQHGNGSVARALQRLRAAWQQYWSDARRLWQPIFDAFRGNGNFDELRAQFTKLKVYQVVSDDLCAIRQMLRELQQVCTDLPAYTGLAGMPALCEALLLMVQPGRADDAAASTTTTAEAVARKPERRSVGSVSSSAGAQLRQSSASTVSPSSNSSGSSEGTDFGI